MAAIPGDVLGTTDQFAPGHGTFVRNNRIHASLLGEVVKVDGEGKRTINVVVKSETKLSELVLATEDIVTCRVTKLSIPQTFVEIIGVGDNPLPFPQKGVIRKEDVRPTEIDQIVMSECFRPGDIVKATIISMGDAKYYYLSTSAPEFGVWIAKNEKGRILRPINSKEMEDPENGERYPRKVAKRN